mmetsp:Transcript_21087/g.30592  ORF Transcript_21087/g.30592 Transcript_21087/m.30592 type:complete len:217 (-) Transcript_21087:82-732(-)|eukprot:CAMPEP_0113934894 /NCGR_PEP_ID=MMETSP1339-20121228/2143_1 /TAXON_ID=94617 /ORGANISM="Fibrocapsa japonica" /LENGTH=216 /DNA_ID=CAMNT_0000936851 /DNA_START=85 /DNA_END=735 /DNA_ORIENTATION=- /assembly_acc=CAM_ASM_000762
MVLPFIAYVLGQEIGEKKGSPSENLYRKEDAPRKTGLAGDHHNLRKPDPDTKNMASVTDKLEPECASRVWRQGIYGAILGGMASAVQNLYLREPYADSMGLVAHRNAEIAANSAKAGVSKTFVMAAACATFAAVECATETVRGKDDPFNAAIAGCAGGMVMSAPAHNAQATVLSCGAGAALMASLTAFSAQRISDPHSRDARLFSLAKPKNDQQSS